MKFFEFGYDGLALGGVIVVMSDDWFDGAELAKKYLKEQNCSDEVIASLYLQCESELNETGIVYDWNGDY